MTTLDDDADRSSNFRSTGCHADQVAPGWNGTRPTLAERSGQPGSSAAQPSAAESTRPRPLGTRHCWITGLPDLPGRHAGLLVEWRRGADQEWQARVVYTVVEDQSPVLIEAWILAVHLTPVS